MLQRVQALAVVDAPQELLVALRVPHKVETGLVQRHGVGGGQNADVVDVRLLGIAVTVAVDGDAVHDVDEDHLVAEIVADALGGLGHGFEKLKLKLVMPVGVAGAAGVDAHLAHRGGEADGGVLDRAAVARHGVSLEVGQHNVRAVVGKMRADEIALQARAARDGDLHGAVLVKDLEVRDVRVAVVLRHLIVLGRRRTEARVGRVALDDGAVDQLHKVLDELGPQIIAVRRLAGRELHRDGPGGLPAQRLIDRDQPLRGDVVRKVDDGFFRFVRIRRRGRKDAQGKAQNDQQGKRFFHGFYLLHSFTKSG